MNSWSNAIIVCIVLVAGAWLLVVNSPAIEPPKPEPKPPTPVVQPVERPVVDAEAGNPIQLYRDVRSLVEFAKQMQKAIQAASRELNAVDFRAAPVTEPVSEYIPPKWTPDERQVVLYFYDDAQPHAYARQLIQQGHTVYRAGSHRRDLRLQFDARSTPLWLVIREGRVIYRSQWAPRFPSTEPVRRVVPSQPVYQSAPVYRYQSAPVYRGGFSCAGGICQ